eukprot:scaffold27285_cov107-Isochrysis_galbana.AAC.3
MKWTVRTARERPRSPNSPWSPRWTSKHAISGRRPQMHRSAQAGAPGGRRAADWSSRSQAGWTVRPGSTGQAQSFWSGGGHSPSPHAPAQARPCEPAAQPAHPADGGQLRGSGWRRPARARRRRPGSPMAGLRSRTRMASLPAALPASPPAVPELSILPLSFCCRWRSHS